MYAEVAEVMEISPKTVDKYLEIALKTLRKELAPYLCWVPLVGMWMVLY